ncbi:protein of unknown function [Marininema mesophilum]|uniref:Cytoskeleton protein RodZ-like C-terminal domain-containing protein n=1 Tax=Marininema mesophilum TaxID=1048340 RepID=A0A1H2ZC00_9BACL|nr:DUF4115 domain-containing protein [Marininema mesophilum]SDX15012.1 protein of unknown function [Marininema mesophilum]
MSAEIGHRLRQARESEGMGLLEVEQKTGIPQTHLMAMEAGDFSKFSSPYYARVSLRTYAIVMGLDSRSILNLYRQSYRADGTFIGGGVDSLNPSDLTPLSDWLQAEERRSLSTRRAEQEGSTDLFTDHIQSTLPPRRDPRFSGQAVEEVEGSTLGETPSSFSRLELPRSVSLPADLPDPNELGLSGTIESAASKEDNLPTEVEGKESQSESGRYFAKQAKKKSSSLGTWYTRFLIAWAILLIPAAIFVAFQVYGDDPPPKQPQKRAAKDQQKKTASNPKESKPILNPVDVGKGNLDQYELSNADKIDLKLKAKGECWIQVSGQEVGDQLKEKVLKKGEVFSFSYKKGNELWLKLGRPKDVEMTVNGLSVKTSYDKERKFRVTLLQ